MTLAVLRARWRRLMLRLGRAHSVPFDDVLAEYATDPEFMADAEQYPALLAQVKAVVVERGLNLT